MTYELWPFYDQEPLKNQDSVLSVPQGVLMVNLIALLKNKGT